MSGIGIRWLVPLEGRRVFSLWAWLALVPFGVLAIGGYDLAADADDFRRGITIAVVVQLALGVVFLLANLLERRIRSDAVHIAFIVFVFIVIAFGRPALVKALQASTGGPLFPDYDLLIRATTNLLTIGVPTLAIFLLVEILRRHARVRRTLAGVIVQTERATLADETRGERLARELRELGIAPVLTAIEGARVVPFSAQRQADALMSVATSVVRPLSNSLDKIANTPNQNDTEPTAAPAIHLGPPLRILPPPPWVAPVGLIVVTATALAVNYRVGASVPILAVLVVGIGLGIVARRTPTERMPPALGITVVAAVNSVIGVLLTLIVLVPAPIEVPPMYWVTTPVAFVAFAVLASLVVSVLDRLAEDERVTAALVASTTRRSTAARSNLRDLADRFRRTMHSTVQDRIVAAATALREGVVGEEIVDDLITRVASDLDRALEPAVLHGSDAASDLLDRAVDRWSCAMPVSVEADPAALAWFAVASVRTELLLEAVSEALSNAVRHGRPGVVTVTIERDALGVRLVVCSPGWLDRNRTNGIGLRSLVEQGAVITLTTPKPGRVQLDVTFGNEIGTQIADRDPDPDPETDPHSE
jgi:signal transduction histidine kinase